MYTTNVLYLLSLYAKLIHTTNTSLFYTKSAKIANATSVISYIYLEYGIQFLCQTLFDILHCNQLAREENIESQAHEIMAKLEMPNSYLRRELL